jgi:hypothetical protein
MVALVVEEEIVTEALVLKDIMAVQAAQPQAVVVEVEQVK